MKRTWITKLFTTPARTATRFTPRLDPLEARDVPATFYVDPAATVGNPVFNAGRSDAFTGTFNTNVFAALDGAVAAANAAPGTDTIRLAHTGNFININTATNTPLAITGSVNIVGDGSSASVLTTANNQSGAVLLVTGAGVVANLTDLGFFGGATAFDPNTGLVAAGGGQTGTAIRYTVGTSGTITRTVWQGIFADGAFGFEGVAIEATGTGTALTVQNSQFSAIGRVGVLTSSNATSSLFGNTYVGKGGTTAFDYFAQVSSGASAVISGNTVSGNQGVNGGNNSAAVIVSQLGGNAATATVFGNTFTGNVDGILVGDNAADTSSVVASYNNILGNFNGIGTVRAAAAPDIDATNVWWGTPTGPRNAVNNPAGTGNDIADDVLFTPVRTSAVPVVAAPTLAAYLVAAFPQTVVVTAVTNAAEPSTAGAFRFTRSGDTSLPLVVNYTVGGTATAGTDYTALPGVVNFAANQTTVDVPVTVIDDTLVEGAETVIVTGTAAAGQTFVGSPATLTIGDNEQAITLAVVTNAAEPGTAGTFRFTRSGDTSLPLVVSYTVGGTAKPGTDYAALSGVVNFAANQTTVDVAVTVIDDTLVEGTETVVVTVTPAATLTITGSPASMNLTDNDNTPVASSQFAVGQDTGGSPTINFYNPDGSLRFTKTVFAAGATGGVRVATGDFNGDGVADVVVGTGPGVATQVKVLNGVGGAELFTVSPFETAFTGGVYVAAGDITGDGVADLVITPDEGGGPRVQVYTGAGFTKIADFLGINDTNFRGGARPAVGDINGDGKAELVVAAGFGGGPRVSVLNGTTIGAGLTPATLFPDFFVFEQALRNGAFVAVGDVNGDGKGDLIAGGGPGGGPRVRAFSGVDLLTSKGDQSTSLINFFAGDVNNRNGIRVAAKNLDGDTKADLVVGDGTGLGSRVTAYFGGSFADGSATPSLNLTAFPGFLGGVFVG